MTALKWITYVWDEPHPVTSREIEQLEQRLGVTFPKTYKEIAAQYQGMTPLPNVFNVGRGTNAVNAFLTIIEDNKWRTYSIMRAYEAVKPHVPKGVYPFAGTPGGEYLCFDYRESPEQPKVTLVTVEMDIYPVADSFTDFMASLHDGEDMLA
jgi:cell wall assembly regulator SMI1